MDKLRPEQSHVFTGKPCIIKDIGGIAVGQLEAVSLLDMTSKVKTVIAVVHWRNLRNQTVTAL